ncbi:ABC-2 family transporter protein [Thermoplasmatales archaeon SCGC AB-540-F20]|nr:ABC-2 family transporter protein [Thermoplasmatales archaeon SCGC AB-540-F20]
MVFVLKLAVNDFKNVIRDRMFVFLFFAYPVMLILISRIIVHLIAPRIGDVFSLAENFSVLFMFFTIAIPMIYSFIVAFLILDERDEHLLTVLRVMPISRNSYLIYRMFFMSLFAFITLLIFPPFSGLVDGTQFSYPAYIPVAILFALFTPFLALLVASFATNKVQAFAIFKIGGTVFMLPIFAFFLNLGDLKYIFSPIPNFWSIMALDSVVQNGTLDIVHLAIGFVFHITLIAVLFYIFNKKN